MNKLKFKAKYTNVYLDFPCIICGGSTNSEEVICTTKDHDHMCLRCMEASPEARDTMLRQYVSGLRNHAAMMESFIGNIEVENDLDGPYASDKWLADDESYEVVYDSIKQ